MYWKQRVFLFHFFLKQKEKRKKKKEKKKDLSLERAIQRVSGSHGIIFQK
jgi:hypothetical protein